MPTYQYACTNPDCGERFERVQAFTDAAISECPVCGQAVRKVYGSVGVVFKGSGFYRNDSRSGAGGASGGGDALSPKDSGAKESGSKDSGSSESSSGSGSSATKESTGSSTDSSGSSGSAGSKKDSSSSGATSSAAASA